MIRSALEQLAPVRRLRDALVDPLPRQLARLARLGLDTGFPWQFLRHPLAALSVARARGLNAAMLHALHASNHPHRAALVDGTRTVSYARADQEINAFAHALRGPLGLQRGEAVALVLENRAEYLLAWFAAMRAGVRVLHAGSHLTADELLHMLRTGHARAVVASQATAPMVRVALAAAGLARGHLVVCDGTPEAGERSWGSLLEGARVDFPEAPKERAESVVFTSGTTGKPKGAARDFVAFGPLELARVLERLPFSCAERHLVVAPLSHSAPQVFALLQTALGSTLYLEPRFEPERTLRALSRERAHSVFLVPTMLRRVLDLPAATQRAWPTPELRAVVVGSSVFDEGLRAEAIARFGAHAVFDFYGATELGWVTLIRGDEMRSHPGSVGRPLPGQQVRILDATGGPSPAGETGLIGVRNAQSMLGYTGDAQATKDTVRAGWTTVEDTGWLDEDGYLYLAGRARDLVKSGGVNVYPAEVERVLALDPQVREVCVIGVPDREWGERVTAVVVPSGPHFDAELARARAKEKLSPAKVPRAWHVVEALPRNVNGKVLRTELRARFSR